MQSQLQGRVKVGKKRLWSAAAEQIRFGILPFGDFDSTLWPALLVFPAGDFHLTIPDEHTPHSLVLGRFSMVWSPAPLGHSSTTVLPGRFNAEHPVEAGSLAVDMTKMIG
jgi:hypothetical protein